MENFNEIIASEQLTLVDFFATWCGPCKMMHPVLEQLKAEMGDAVRIIKIDVDKNEALCNDYRIQSVPEDKSLFKQLRDGDNNKKDAPLVKALTEPGFKAMAIMPFIPAETIKNLTK